jgi:TetR/AcrR family transcriptional regulator, repressor of fatR-cypB operon
VSKQDKREEIIRTSLELIAEHGFHGAPMAMIADVSGVAVGTIYRFFESKDVLITELYRELEARIYPVIQNGYSPLQPIRVRFLHLFTSLLCYFIANPLDFRFLEQFHNSPYGVACRRDKFLGTKDGCDVFYELFTDGLTQQVLKDLPMVVLFNLAFGPMISVARDHILGFIEMDEVLIQRTAEACWDGLKR